jgi:hypothetical protein
MSNLKEQAKEFGQQIEKSNQNIQEIFKRSGLSKDKDLTQRVERLNKEAKETVEYIKQKTENA